MKQTRRGFLRTSTSWTAATVTGGWLVGGRITQAASAVTGTVPRRPLGRTGEEVSLLGVGGFHLGMCPEPEAIRLVHEALDHGVNFMDNAWEYHAGRSEERLGKALRGRREKAFIMTKHHGRDRTTARRHLEDSLRRLRTDMIDLWMFHECVYDEDPDRIYAPGGGLEAAVQARDEGKVRFLGFTGHKDPQIHLKMLAYGFPFDAVLMPLNILDGSFKSFEKWVLPVLVKRGIAPLAMKSRASGAILKAGLATVEECWRYTASLPVSVVVSGMPALEILRDNLRLATTLKPMTAAERRVVLARTREVALTGKHERFKTTRAFDGPAGRKLYGITG